MPRWVDAKRVTFKYGLGEEFINVLQVLHLLGLDSTTPVRVRSKNGPVEVAPRDVVAAALPDPATIGPRMTGKTCAGLWVTGIGTDGEPREVYLYHVADNEWTMAEYESPVRGLADRAQPGHRARTAGDGRLERAAACSAPRRSTRRRSSSSWRGPSPTAATASRGAWRTGWRDRRVAAAGILAARVGGRRGRVDGGCRGRPRRHPDPTRTTRRARGGARPVRGDVGRGARTRPIDAPGARARGQHRARRRRRRGGCRRAPPPVGATLGFLGWSGGLHLHSHMNAVDPAARGRGIGVALKLRQRAVCLAHGVDEMRWTYDPLIRRNARTQPRAARRRGRRVPPRLLRRARRRDHRSRPQRPLRGALAPRLAAHGARARARPAARVALRGRPRPRRRLRGRASRGPRGRRAPARRLPWRRSPCCVPTPGSAPSSMPPATTSSRATTPTGRPDERHERHDADTRRHRHGDRAHRAAPPRGAAGAAVRDLLRARDGARGAPRARRHRRGRRLGRVRRRSRPVLLGRVRRRRGIRDRALSRLRRCSTGTAAMRRRAVRLRMPRARRRPRDRVRAGRPCRSRHPWRRPSRSSRAIAWRRPRSRRPCSTRSCARRAARWASCSAPTREWVDCGVSVGIAPTLEELLDEVDGLRRGGVPPHQAQDQARLGPRAGRRGPRGARAARAAAGRREHGVHGRRHPAARRARRVRPAADRAAVRRGGPRHPRAARRRVPHAGLPRRVDPRRDHGGRRDRPRGDLGRQHQAGPHGRVPRGPPRARRLPRARRARSGAAACSRPGSAAPRTSRSPRCRASRCPATRRRRRATSPRTSPSRSCSATASTAGSCGCRMPRARA